MRNFFNEIGGFIMASDSYFNRPPFDTFPFKTFLQVLDKMEYLGEESSPYEVSPGTDLCISDTYYSLGFLTYIHSFGRVVNDGDEWFLDPKGEIPPEKPYRFKLISDAVDVLHALMDGHRTITEIKNVVSSLSEEKIDDYLNVLQLLSQKSRIVQRAKGWDATFVLTEWDQF